jgi:hypothetical protein
MSKFIDYDFEMSWLYHCGLKMNSIDVYDLKDGEIRNINESTDKDYDGDLGVDNKRNGYYFMGGKWRPLMQ